MNKATGPLEVIDYCANPKCQAEILFGQGAIRYGQELLCSQKCLRERIGAVIIIVVEHENDPTG